MNITLLSHEYEIVRDMDDHPLVIRKCAGFLWRVANLRDTAKVLAGAGVPVLRVVE